MHVSETTTIETVSLVRPLKLIAFVIECISFILLVVAVSTAHWVESDTDMTGIQIAVHQGLWTACTSNDGLPVICESNQKTAWIKSVAAFCILTLISILVGIVYTLAGLLRSHARQKQLMYRISLILMLIAAFFLLIGLIIFTVLFWEDIQSREYIYHWFFNWSYAFVWGSWFFIVAAAILLFFERENSVVKYVEKGSRYPK